MRWADKVYARTRMRRGAEQVVTVIVADVAPRRRDRRFGAPGPREHAGYQRSGNVRAGHGALLSASGCYSVPASIIVLRFSRSTAKDRL